MLIVEYRISLPMTTSEYQVGQLYNVALASKETTNEEEGIEIVKNEPFQNDASEEGKTREGQYTYKIYHLESKIPSFVRLVLSSKNMSVHEEAWNAFPHCKTVLTSPFLGNIFKITIETMHLDDDGSTNNALNLSEDILKERKVVYIDIANDVFSDNDYSEKEDPRLYKSEKTNRGPLGNNWKENMKPLMTCYKLVTVEFRWFGLQTRVENWIQTAEQKLFWKFHRQMFCNMDSWCEMNMDDIRRMEDEVKEELNRVLQKRLELAKN